MSRHFAGAVPGAASSGEVPYRDDDDADDDASDSAGSDAGMEADAAVGGAAAADQADQALSGAVGGAARAAVSEVDDEGDIDDAPDLHIALEDPMFRAMCNFMLQAMQELVAGTNLVVTQEAFEALHDVLYEHVYLPRVGWADDETDPERAAIPLQP